VSGEVRFTPLPAEGRVFEGRCRVRLGDAAPSRRARLDALARFLQDVAEDDAEDAGWPRAIGWVLRRTQIAVRQFPVLGEELHLQTFCSATGSRWAERTTTLSGDGGGSVQAISVWVAIDTVTGAPARLGALFDRIYGPSAAGRRASLRLQLPPPPAAVEARPWPLRAADLDVWGHVNNAVSWAAVEDVLARTGWLPVVAELEHHQAITADVGPVLMHQDAPVVADVWLCDGAGGPVLSSARLHRGDRG